VLEGQTEEDDGWRIGHPILFPNILKVGSSGHYNMQFRVPIDDTHTYHVAYQARRPKPGEEPTPPDRVPVRDAQVFDPVKGRFKVESNKDLAQDVMAWVTAGPVMDRSQEHLADSDRGIILLRKLLKEQMAIVAEGGEPMNVFRDPAEAAYVEIKTEEDKYVARLPESGERIRYGAFGIFGGDEDMRRSGATQRDKI
jgi:5,5'-dehydrodivanillate O-demethylase